MPFFGNRKLPCTLHPSPSTGGAAAQPPCKTPQLPCKIAANKETPEGTEKDAPALKRILEAFSADAAPVAAEVEKLLALPPEEQPAAAEALLKKLPNLFPDDPQIAAILAEEMAAAFAEALEKGIGDGEPVVENKNCPEDGGFIGKDGCTHRNHSARSREPETPSQRDRHGMADETRLAADPALNIPRAKSAMEEVMRKKNGFVERGAYRPETGWIRLDYGDPGDPANDYKGGHGLSHIAAKHPEDVRHLPEVLAKGTLHKHEQEGKIYVAHGSRFAVLAPLKKGGKKTVTSYEPDNADRVALIKQRPPVKRPGAH